jgi:RNA polymerase sigma-70 factor, ECF subfamily
VLSACPEPDPDAARTAIDAVARTSYGRLLAYLAAGTRDLAAAEDALAEAFVAAVRTWPAGVPEHPEAWLLTAARRALIDAARCSGPAP